MSKKLRKNKPKYRRQEILKPDMVQASAQMSRPVPIAAKAAAVAKSQLAVADMSTRYLYVLTELKYIGIIAGALFLVLIILSFFLH